VHIAFRPGRIREEFLFRRWPFYRESAFTAHSVILRKLDVGDLRPESALIRAYVPWSSSAIESCKNRLSLSLSLLFLCSLHRHDVDRKLDVADLCPSATQQRLNEASRSSKSGSIYTGETYFVQWNGEREERERERERVGCTVRWPLHSVARACEKGDLLG